MRTVGYKLNKQQQEGLFVKLARAVALLRNPVEGAEFIKDLLSESEVIMLARRLQVAELLIEGKTYREISKELKVGLNTIVKIQTWLNLYGEGYRSVVAKVSKQAKDRQEPDPHRPFAELKRKYPLYFWPQLLLEELVKTANKREKERLRKIISQSKEKTQLSRQLSKLLQ